MLLSRHFPSFDHLLVNVTCLHLIAFILLNPPFASSGDGMEAQQEVWRCAAVQAEAGVARMQAGRHGILRREECEQKRGMAGMKVEAGSGEAALA